MTKSEFKKDIGQVLKKSQFRQTQAKGSIEEMKNLVNADARPAFLCSTFKVDNPNYLAIIHSNQPFQDIFGISSDDLIGESYDFLFDDLDINYSSEDQLEYIRLIKDIKQLSECSIIMSLRHVGNNETQISKFKITFQPMFLQKDVEEKSEKFYAIFSFERIDSEEGAGEVNISKNQLLVKNLERALHNEKLLGDISYWIISDMPVKEVAQNIASALAQHLKIDRCIIYDCKNKKHNFIVEYRNPKLVPMLDGSDKAKQYFAEFIDFQHNFYNRIKTNDRNHSIFVIEDPKRDPSFTKFHDFFNSYGVASQINAITSFDDEINGGIYLFQSEKRSLTVDTVELIELISDQLAMAIDRSYSIEKVMIANHNLVEKTLQLKEAVKKEKELRKMQSEFVALVSHEFKTPLQIIDSTRELVARRLKSLNLIDESFEKALERIKSGIQRMDGLINSTLDLAKIESDNAEIKIEKQNFDVIHLIKDIIEKTANLSAGKNIKIVTQFCRDALEINADHKLLDHCFTNVIANAIKYSQHNTNVTVIVKENNEKIAVQIIDQGMGIPQDDLAKIGSKFFRAKNTLAVSGTGIGLYLTKYFVNLHQGEVLIDSKVGIGTSITIILPKN